MQNQQLNANAPANNAGGVGDWEARRAQALAEAEQYVAQRTNERFLNGQFAMAVKEFNQHHYGFFLDRKKTSDYAEYRKTIADNKRYERENKMLNKYNLAHQKLELELEKYKILERANVLTPKEMAVYEKLKVKERKALNVFYAKIEKMIARNNKLLNKNKISQIQHDLRESQLNSFDFTYNIMRKEESVNEAKQLSAGTISRLPDALAIEQDPVRQQELAALVEETAYLRRIQNGEPACEPVVLHEHVPEAVHEIVEPVIADPAPVLNVEEEEPRREAVDLAREGVVVRRQADRQVDAPQNIVEQPAPERDINRD